jgi:hypothetical protein
MEVEGGYYGLGGEGYARRITTWRAKRKRTSLILIERQEWRLLS